MKSSKIKKIRTSSLKAHKTKCSIPKNPTVSIRGPLVQQEDRLATEMTSLKRSSDLKKEDRGLATILVGETKKVFVLIVSATSTSTKRNRSKGSAKILVGETRRVSMLSVRSMSKFCGPKWHLTGFSNR